MQVRFGISGLPPEDGDDAAFLDGLAGRGHRAFELAFVKGFPWKEARCSRFGELAAARDIWVSLHAPYFAILTVQDEDKAGQCLAALEHSMKLGAALGARIIVAHPGPTYGRDGDELHALVSERLERLTPKVERLGVGLGLETAGKTSAFGSLGDIALLSERFPFVRPVVDWAHVHAVSGGGLSTPEGFAAVFSFLTDRFPAWMIDPLHTQFTANQFGPSGEIRHVPYGTTDLRVAPMIEAAAEAGISLTVISEAREDASHEAIAAEIGDTLARLEATGGPGRPLASGRAEFPEPLRVAPEGGRFRPLRLHRPLLLSNIDKRFFPEGYTKGDLIQYYASVADVLLPHLTDRPLSMRRFPDGIDGDSFFEKRAPGHQPEWMRTVAVPSESTTIDFLVADSREALMWFANMGCVEVHPFHARAGSLHTPDYAIFDLDPADGATWEQIVGTAQLIGVALDQMGLVGYPKLSGSRGIHVYVPLEPVHPFDRVRRFVEATGRLLAQANPDEVTVEWEKSKRRGKVFVDANRNAYGQTVAAVYSVRPRRGAPVSVPVRWEELHHLRNGDVTIANLWERLQRHGDLFAPVLGGSQTLDRAEAALGLA